MSKQKLIGTGLSGMVGSRIVELLQDEYSFVDFSLDRKIDITDSNNIKKVFSQHQDSDFVLHLAAFTNVDAANKQPGDKNGSCYQVNVIGTRNVAKLCNLTNKYLIHISTDFVFNGVNPPPGGYTENHTPMPVEWYGETKYLAEKEVQKHSNNYTILRIAFPYKLKHSKKETFIKNNGKKMYKLDLIRKMISSLQAGKKLNLFSDQYICPTYIDDIADVVRQVLNQKPKNELFHCVGSETKTPYEIGQLITKSQKLDPNLLIPITLKEYYQNNPNARKYQKKVVLSTKKLYNSLGIKPISISQGIRIYAN